MYLLGEGGWVDRGPPHRYIHTQRVSISSQDHMPSFSYVLCTLLLLTDRIPYSEAERRHNLGPKQRTRRQVQIGGLKL